MTIKFDLPDTNGDDTLTVTFLPGSQQILDSDNKVTPDGYQIITEVPKQAPAQYQWIESLLQYTTPMFQVIIAVNVLVSLVISNSMSVLTIALMSMQLTCFLEFAVDLPGPVLLILDPIKALVTFKMLEFNNFLVIEQLGGLVTIMLITSVLVVFYLILKAFNSCRQTT